MRLLIIDNKKNLDPYVNLAIERYLQTNCGEKGQMILMFWQVKEAVIIGRSQNVWTEVDVNKCMRENIPIVRRKSGGGAVYQDLGNLNFSFIWKCNSFSVDDTYKILLNSFKEFGINSFISNGNDIETKINGKDYKFSGSAFHDTKDYHMHHGTILIDLNVSNAHTYLTPSMLKLQSKGISSIKERMVNLKKIVPGITTEKIKKSIISEAAKYFNTKPILEHEFSDSEMNNCAAVDEFTKELRAHHWLFNKHYSFTVSEEHELFCGHATIQLKIANDKIANFSVFTDCINQNWVQVLSDYFTHNFAKINHWKSNIAKLSTKHPELKKYFDSISTKYFNSFNTE